ncbi:MAG: symmetrical bis(5'-nucleosyl)-tetraphosphatase [Pseudomonadales bacterium]
MTIWAIGDVQGCLDELRELLDRIEFDPACDTAWFVGDLVNRGPDSLGVLRFVRGLGAAARTVLGNHDLHLLAIYLGGHPLRGGDTFADVLAADDAEELCDWLRRQPLLVLDRSSGFVMTHAGIPHIWSLEEAQMHAAEVEQVLAGPDASGFLRVLYGNRPDVWRANLESYDRLRLITNYFTRMRLIAPDGRLDFAYKGPLQAVPDAWVPWFELRAKNPLPVQIAFGHWASLEGHSGQPGIHALDTGCVWGRSLSAIRLDSLQIARVASHHPVASGAEIRD